MWIERASVAGQWEIVARLAGELEARRVAVPAARS
jgi:hypothetical protein